MQLVSAMQDRCFSLYHYQALKDRGLGYLEQTLRHRTIHMSRPSSFNDPWDCKPWFNSSILDSADERELHLQWLVATQNVRPAEEAELRGKPVLLRALIEQVRDGHVRGVDDRYRVYCMSPDATIQLMWAHYGDNHRGVALEYDARADQVLWAYRVNYSQQYPTQRLYDDEDNANLVPIFTKSDVWSYEREYRLLAEEMPGERANMLRTVDSTLTLARGALIGVVLGCQCDEDPVIELLDRCARDLRVRRVRRVMDRYALTLETIREARP